MYMVINYPPLHKEYGRRTIIFSTPFNKFLMKYPTECQMIINHNISHVCVEEKSWYVLCIEEEYAPFATLCGLSLKPYTQIINPDNLYYNVLFE